MSRPRMKQGENRSSGCALSAPKARWHGMTASSASSPRRAHVVRRVAAPAHAGDRSKVMLRTESHHANSGRRGSKAHSPVENVPEHHPIAGETVERMREGRGPVFLEEEMAGPGKAIAGDRRQ